MIYKNVKENVFYVLFFEVQTRQESQVLTYKDYSSTTVKRQLIMKKVNVLCYFQVQDLLKLSN